MIIKSYTFEAEPVLMDFHDFRHCTFRKCRLIYCGYSPVAVDNCRFEECRWEFSGPAMATLQFLAHLHQGGTEMGRNIVAQAIATITKGPPPPPVPNTPAAGAGAGAGAIATAPPPAPAPAAPPPPPAV